MVKWKKRKHGETGELRHSTSACLPGSTPAAGRKRWWWRRDTQQHPSALSLFFFFKTLSKRTGRGRAKQARLVKPVIGRFMSFLVMWNLGRASKGPRNKHLDNSIVRFRLPSPAESSTTIPILRPCNQQARQPGCGSTGPRAEPTPRGMDGTAATTSNRTTNKEPFVRSSEETKRNLRRNWERKNDRASSLTLP